MYNLENVTAQTMLYHISEQKIDEFKRLAQPLQPYIAQLFTRTNRVFNMNIPICNMWLVLHAHLPDEKPLFLNETLRITYHTGFYLNEMLEKHKGLRQFVAARKLDKAKLIVLAAHLEIELMTWLQQLVTQAQADDIFQLYLLEEQANERMPHDAQFQQALSSQKQFIQLVTSNIGQCDAFEQAIARAIHDTKAALLHA